MRQLICYLIVLFCTSAFAQNEPIIHILTRGNQEILLNLPAATIVHNDTAVTINGWPATIIAVEKSVYDTDSHTKKKNEMHLLDAVFNTGIGAASENLLEKPIAIISPVRDGRAGIFWVENFKDETQPAKISGCIITGDYILQISMERTVNKENLTSEAFKHTQFIREIFSDVVVMEDGQCIFPARMSITYVKSTEPPLNLEFEDPFNLSPPLLFSPLKKN